MTDPVESGVPLLEVSNLTVSVGDIALVDRVSFVIEADSKVGLIGESGSGKSLTALAIMGLLPDGLRATGSVRLNGIELLGLSERQLVAFRGNDMAMIFQEPMTALNPLHRVGGQVAESLMIHNSMGRAEAKQRAVELLAEVGIDDPERRAQSFPHQLSGGQRQRVMIAAAIACSPDLVIADEPTTALDVTVQQQVLAVLSDEANRNDAALMLITHDLPVVSNVAESVMVMRDGRLVETGPTAATFADPVNPYTRSLVDSVPPLARTDGAGQQVSTVAADPDDSTRRDRGDGTDEDDGTGEGEVLAIEVIGVSKTYRLPRTQLFGPRPTLTALDQVSLEIRPGETFGVVGESGSGKSTLARTMMGLLTPDAGSINVMGIDTADRARHSELQRTVQMIFQDPNGSLDPRLRVADVIAEPLRSLQIGGDHRQRVSELLEAVRLDADAARRYPHEFSGGQRQRIAIARALAPNPRVLIADEAVSALDMSVQTVVLELLDELKAEFDLTMVFVSHDLSVVAQICERVAVLQKGRVVETGGALQVLTAPSEDYTKRLVASIPKLVVG